MGALWRAGGGRGAAPADPVPVDVAPVPVDPVPVADAAGAGDGVLDESAELSVAFRVAAAPVGPDAPDPGLPGHAPPAMMPAPARIAATVIPTVQCRAWRRSRAKCWRPPGGSCAW